MRRLIPGVLLTAGLALAATSAQAQETVRFWFHFDNPDNPMADLVAEFEAAHPDIRIEAENVPWNSYYDNLYTAIVGGNAPDAAMVKMFAQPRLIEMGALEPIGDRIDAWDGKADILDNLFELNSAADGTRYYLPIQYVVLYLYYRTDWFAEAGIEPPVTCEDFRDAAITLTQDTDGDGNPDTYGFGFRGGRGGHDHWATFVLPQSDGFDALTSEAGIAASQWVIDLHRVDQVFPPSAPNDGFQEIIGAFQSGITAMTIHHIGSSADMVAALGDNVSAVPVPECGGGRWTSFGDESTAIFAASEVKDAAWEWISFLSSAGANAKFNEATGQLPVTRTDSESWDRHESRFVEATVNSLPFAALLPNVPETSDFVNTVWPVAMQRALTGEISAEEMNAEIAALYGN